MAEYFLGIDGGQSSTVAVIGDESGRMLGSGQAGPCNHVSGSERREKFLTAIVGATVAAAKEAQMPPVPFAAACLGFSGGADDKADLTREAVNALRIHVTHDAAIALDGALGGEPGVLVISGTGSIAFGRSAENRELRSGGWGYVFGDEGSAFDIGRQALRAALRQEEGWGPATDLTPVLLQLTQSSSANQLLHRCYTPEFPRQKVAQWAQLVDLAANNGDAIAAEILRGAAQQLAMLAATVRRRLFGERGPAIPVSYAGGVFQSARVRETFQMLATLDGSMEVTAPRHSAAAGALIGAYRLAGLAPQITGELPLK